MSPRLFSLGKWRTLLLVGLERLRLAGYKQVSEAVQGAQKGVTLPT